MRLLKIAVIIVGFSILSAPASNAQLKGLLKRAKDKAEDTLERKAENEVDRQVEALVNNLWDEAGESFGSMLESALPKAKTTVDLEGGIIRREGLDDLEIRDNATKPADAEYLSYLLVSTMNLPGQLSDLVDVFGNATVDEVFLHGDLKLSGNAEQGTLTDAGAEKFVYIDHEAEEFWSMGFSEMFDLAAGAMADLRARMEEMPAPSPAEADDVPDYEMEVNITTKKGKRKTVRGVRAQQNIVIVETITRSEEAEAEGKFYLVTDLWTAENFGGSETLASYDQRVGKAMLESMSGSNLNTRLNFGGFSDPRMGESLQKASEKLSEIEGVPIETNTYFVVGPIDKDLDLDAVLNGDGETDVRSFSGVSHDEPVEAQATMFSTTAFITNLSTDPFELARLNPHTAYAEVESPLKQYMQVDGDD